MHTEHNLFPTPVLQLSLPETADLREQYMPEIEKRWEEGFYGKPDLWETDRVHSSFGHNVKIFNGMPECYQNVFMGLLGDTDWRASIWHNAYKSGEWQEKHYHVPATLSAIHFIQFDPAEHKPPVFYDPAALIKQHVNHKSLPSQYWRDKEIIPVKQGDMLIFPSYLEHFVPPGDYQTLRVTISINIYILPEIWG